MDQLNLLGKEILALDGSKFRAQNAKKNNYTQKKIDRHKAYYDNLIAGYRSSDFAYYPDVDAYVCPQGYWLTTTGTLTTKGNHDYRIKTYRAGAKCCRMCPAFGRCTTAKNGRIIERSEYHDAVVRNAERINQNQDLYRRRQAIVEHPFGTIKRGWGYDHTLLKGLQKVNGEIALIFLVYNLRRSMSILSVKGLIEALKSPFLGVLRLWRTLRLETSKIYNELTRAISLAGCS